MKKIIFYTNPNSRGLFVRWMLEECGAKYEVVPIQFGEEIKSEKYLSINPMGKLPAIAVDGKIITETAAIITFLADMFPEKKLIPAVDSIERGEFYRWMFFAVHAEYALMDKLFDIPSNELRRNGIGYGDFDTAFNTLTDFLKGKKYAIGNSFTALDLWLSALLGWGIRREVFPKEGVLADYMNQHIIREAFIKSQGLDKELAKEMGLE